jgi:hypothetical protein
MAHLFHFGVVKLALIFALATVPLKYGVHPMVIRKLSDENTIVKRVFVYSHFGAGGHAHNNAR